MTIIWPHRQLQSIPDSGFFWIFKAPFPSTFSDLFHITSLLLYYSLFYHIKPDQISLWTSFQESPPSSVATRATALAATPPVRVRKTMSIRVCLELPGYRMDTNCIGLDSIESKHGMDPSKMRSTNEKITDTGREMFEKKTGYVSSLFLTVVYTNRCRKHVPEKISN